MVRDKVIHKTVPERGLIIVIIICPIQLAKFKCKLKLKATFLCAVIRLKMIVD